MPLVLTGSTLSPCVRKVAVSLVEKGVAYIERLPARPSFKGLTEGDRAALAQRAGS